jgi:hypothetical protein
MLSLPRHMTVALQCLRWLNFCFAIIFEALKTINTFIQIEFNRKSRFHDTFSWIGNFKNDYFTDIWNCVEKLRAVLIFRLNREYDWVKILVYGLVSFRIINSKLLLDLPCIKKKFQEMSVSWILLQYSCVT